MKTLELKKKFDLSSQGFINPIYNVKIPNEYFYLKFLLKNIDKVETYETGYDLPLLKCYNIKIIKEIYTITCLIVHKYTVYSKKRNKLKTL